MTANGSNPLGSDPRFYPYEGYIEWRELEASPPKCSEAVMSMINVMARIEQSHGILTPRTFLAKYQSHDLDRFCFEVVPLPMLYSTGMLTAILSDEEHSNCLSLGVINVCTQINNWLHHVFVQEKRERKIHSASGPPLLIDVLRGLPHSRPRTSSVEVCSDWFRTLEYEYNISSHEPVIVQRANMVTLNTFLSFEANYMRQEFRDIFKKHLSAHE